MRWWDTATTVPVEGRSPPKENAKKLLSTLDWISDRLAVGPGLNATVWFITIKSGSTGTLEHHQVPPPDSGPCA